MENKTFIQNINGVVGRDKIENYLYKLTYELIAGVVEEKCRGVDIKKKDKDFIAQFYKYGFVGVMLEWIDHGMKDDYRMIVEKMSVTLHGNIANSIHNFSGGQKL